MEINNQNEFDLVIDDTSNNQETDEIIENLDTEKNTGNNNYLNQNNFC